MKLLGNSDRSVDEVCQIIRTTYAETHYVRVTLSTGRDRSLEMNALWFALYTRISETLGDGSAEDIAHWRAYCKLRCGVPILNVHSEDFRDRWYKLVLCNPELQGWHQQLALMSDTMFGIDGFPVTRLFTTKPGCEYTESVVRHFSDQGVFFDDLLDGDNGHKRTRNSSKGRTDKAARRAV